VTTIMVARIAATILRESDAPFERVFLVCIVPCPFQCFRAPGSYSTPAIIRVLIEFVNSSIGKQE
jgi:hypothetical protein